MGLVDPRSLNEDLDSGLTDGRERKDNPNWGGQVDPEEGWSTVWGALHGGATIQGRR
ncbi:hypothetical protein [Streptomyces sp. NPDC004528]|uniref:hypothetical protein n=1 Tax=Streptomyces sp. NPDC004528 TaxID=3154550 RepID=UPI0033BCD3C9